MLVPIVTTTAKRMAGMMKLLSKLTGGTGASFILFKTMLDPAGFGSDPSPDPEFLLEPWQRVGHEPFDVARVLSGDR
ncbi:MAG: hypothetical protein FJX68_07555 [Alphaproteobacteria bacterium]|nr:hypothetical protein [Alphaproteobacteria bacterium]